MEKRIRFWWDDNTENPGWFAVQEFLEDGAWEHQDDSQKVWFLAYLDPFEEDEIGDVVDTLKFGYSDHTIIHVDFERGKREEVMWEGEDDE